MRKKTVGIYKLTNKINGMIYVGASTNIEARLNSHKQKSKVRENLFYSDIKKYGFDAFEKNIIEICQETELDEKEIYWISKMKEKNKLYNILSGGKRNYKRRISKETRDKISKSLTGKPSTKNMLEREKARKLLLENNPKSKKVVCDGVVYNSISELYRFLGLNDVVLSKRIKGTTRSEKKYFDMNIHFLNEKNSMVLKDDSKHKIICDEKTFLNAVECAEYFNVNVDTMRCY